jgi:hypothetical protein
MAPSAPASLHTALDDLGQRGFAFAHAQEMQAALHAQGSLDDWEAFAASWNALYEDTYMADRGRYRQRRFGVFAIDAEGIVEQPRQPHYQSLDYNRLNGGLERWYQPIDAAIRNGPSLRTILGFAHRTFAALTREVVRWHVEVHQFRILARADEAGQPTPEGMHRDGVDYVLVLLVDRHNIDSGTTSIHDTDGRELGSFTLTQPLDSALVDDARVCHGVTPVTAHDPDLDAHRDVLVVTFRRS